MFILNHGFSFSVFVCCSSIVDGHQRIATTKELLKDGYEIDKIPVIEIEAKTESEVAEKLLLLNSRYAKITDEGLYEYINEFNLDLEDFKADLEIPEIDIDSFFTGYFENVDPEEINQDDQNNQDIVIKVVIRPSVWAEHSEPILKTINEMVKEYKKGISFQVNE